MAIPTLFGIVPVSDGQSTQPDSITIRIEGTTVPFTMIRCPAKSVDDKDSSTVPIKSLYVLTTEVTWDLYDIFVFKLDQPEDSSKADAVTRPSKPYIPPDRGFGHGGYPAIGMTRVAAEQFCQWVSLKTGLAMRLPTLDEWTFLAVGDSNEPYCCDVDVETLQTVAWFMENAEHTTHPVGSRQANQFGLFDVHGNVAEWVAIDTQKPTAMGGGFRDSAKACTATSSQQQQQSWNISDPQIPKSKWWLADCTWVGFRFVVDADSIKETILKELKDE